jgi:hypothetical protein
VITRIGRRDHGITSVITGITIVITGIAIVITGIAPS